MGRELPTSVATGRTSLLDHDEADLVLPDYGGACISEVVPTLVHRRPELAPAVPWCPAGLLSARQIVLFVLDGLGYDQLVENRALMPNLTAMIGAPITSVAPTTTATALTSIVTGTAPAVHGLLGYRLQVGGEVLNVLRWTRHGQDARSTVPPASLQQAVPFCGESVPVISRAEFSGTGFTEAHLPGVALTGWRVASSIPIESRRLLADGAPFIYAYYDGIDKIAHEKGLGEHYLAELAAVDRLVGEMASVLLPGSALVITSDHGQVEVTRPPIVLEPEIACDVASYSGEGRFRWLHVVPGARESVLAACREAYGDLAFVRSREEVIEEGWFGGRPRPEACDLLGDVALVARAPIAFFDPDDTGELRLISRHGALTRAEVLVPFLTTIA